jgi:hypothetical protein
MITLAKRFSFIVAAIVAGAGVAGAQDLRTPPYRPYITEVGSPRVIDRARFDREVAVNTDLRSWVQNYGYPDVAEIQTVVPQFGWSDYEVRTYYFDRNQELAFGRVSFFPAQVDEGWIQDYGLIKYQGALQPENRQRVQYAARLCGSRGSPLDRVLAAAERAERASTLAERESLRALQAAERAQSAASRLESGFSRTLHK